MSPDELARLIAAAPPGARVTVVAFEIPGTPAQLSASVTGGTRPVPAPGVSPPRVGSADAGALALSSALPPDVPPPWTPAPGLAELAPIVAARREPFSCAELAAVLQVKSATVSSWCKTGVLGDVPRLPGGAYRIPPAAVLAMLAGSTPRGAASSQSSGVPAAGASDVAGDGTGAGADSHPVRAATRSHGSGPTGAPASPAHTPAGTGVDPEAGDDDASFDVSSLGDWRAARRGSLP